MIGGTRRAGRPPDATEASRRRRAVHKGLAPFLQGDELMQALWLWEQRASSGPAFALHDYVMRVCERPALKPLRSAMHLSLVRSMALPLERLGPDPWPLMQAVKRGRPAAPPPAPSGDSAGAEVFECILDHLFKSLHQRQPGGVARIRVWLHERLGARLDALGVDAVMATQMVRWLNGSLPHIGVPIPAGALRRLLNGIYVLACEYYGPVATDAALADAVRAAEQLPSARRFSPRSLL